MKRKLSCFSERKCLQVIHKAGEQFGLVQSIIDMFRIRLIYAIDNSFKIPLNDMKRRAKFMSNVGSQVTALLVCAFEFGNHMVETPRQKTELTWITFGHPHAQIAFRNGI